MVARFCYHHYLLLAFAFTGCEYIRPGAAEANIISIAASELIISPAAENTIVSAEAIHRVHTRTADDKVIACGAGQYPCAGDEVREELSRAGRWFEIIDIDG